MIVVKGKYNEAKIFADEVDAVSVAQVTQLCNQKYAEGLRIRMMPDIHAGAGCTIGTTMTVGDKVCPNLVSYDIGCGMLCVELEEKSIDFALLDAVIAEYVPSGMNIHTPDRLCRNAEEVEWKLNGLRCPQADIPCALRSLGTLGGGNHFIEIDRDDDGKLYLVIHSGSRHLGKEVAGYYQDAGYRELKKPDQEKVREIIDRLKAEGRQKDIQTELKRLGPQEKVGKDLAYVSGKLLEDYLHDVRICQEYAAANRRAMADEILHRMDLHEADSFETIHNYIDTEHGILRKGAVSAQKGERLLIPINMRDGSLICIGKGNPDWNYSAPHGAGRLFSRSQAKECLTMKEFAEEMEGVYTTSVGLSTLDESPMAYKPMSAITKNIADTCEIVKTIRPVYNFKAH